MDKLGYVNCICYPKQTIAKPNKSYNAVENETVTSKGQKSNTSENGGGFFCLAQLQTNGVISEAERMLYRPKTLLG